MNKKRIILVSLLLGLALALLGLLLLFLLTGGDRDGVPAAAAEAVQAPTAVLTAAPTAVPTAIPTEAPTEDPRLQLSTGPVDRSVTELTLTGVTEADLALIRELPALTLLDGRACGDYALLKTFSETVTYPVLWSVPLGSVRVDSDATELMVPADIDTAEAVTAALNDLPHIQTVDLRNSGLGNEAAAALREAKPEVTFLYDVTIQGSRLDADTKTLELAADSITDWDALAREIGYLRDLEGIVVTGTVTPEQAAYLLEGAGTIPVRYSVAFKGRTISSEDEEVDFSDLPASDLGAIKGVLTVLPNIRKVNLDPQKGSSKWTLDEADQLQTFREGMLVNYTTKYFGVSFSLADEVVSFNKKNLKKKVNDLKELLPYLRNVKRVDMENCSIDNETMAALRDEFPQPKLVWRVKVGGYSVRTDAWMIKFSAGGSRTLTDTDCKDLKYCREIKYLDLGHNKIHHMDGFVPYMPDLEVCIMYNPMSNIKGIEACPKLEFFECYSCNLHDLSPLAACTELKHLDVCFNAITDITPLYGLTKLERLWISRNDGIPEEQFEKFHELVPNCVVNRTVHNPTGDGWREDETGAYVPRYALLRQQFMYDYTTLRSYGDGWYEDKTVHMGPLPTA